MKSTRQLILDGYHLGTLAALAVLVVVYVVVFVLYGHLLDFSRGMDWLLAGIWMLMTALLTWNIDPRRDLPLAAAAALGGFTIEWWGTTTELWFYFTRDRPPIWIIPAWPVAALAVDRIALFVDRMISRDTKLAWAYWPLVISFVVGMTWFAWPTRHILSTSVVVGLMIGVSLSTTDIRRDVVLFLAGAALGILLEYWGTSRYCWTYYTREMPPPVTIVAHGFASVAFSRVLEISRWALSLVPAPSAMLPDRPR